MFLYQKMSPFLIRVIWYFHQYCDKLIYCLKTNHFPYDVITFIVEHKHVFWVDRWWLRRKCAFHSARTRKKKHSSWVRGSASRGTFSLLFYCGLTGSATSPFLLGTYTCLVSATERKYAPCFSSNTCVKWAPNSCSCQCVFTLLSFLGAWYKRCTS